MPVKHDAAEILQRLYQEGISLDICIYDDGIRFDAPNNNYFMVEDAQFGFKLLGDCVTKELPDSDFAKWWKTRNGCCGESIEIIQESLLAPPLIVCNNCKKEIDIEEKR